MVVRLNPNPVLVMVGKLVFLRSENGLLSASIYSASAQQRLSHLVGAAPAVAGAGLGILLLLLLFLGQGVSGVPYSSIGRSKHAEYESVCYFDVLLKLFEFWPKNKLLKLFN